ncbi:hypothetical protein HY417_03560 [Candidatus Kaiserbacteria bacterium]|nr:hypothetical protein [Candidatus Kaiserbacteria bacterium]
MNDHIPRAWFIFGEFRRALPKRPEGVFATEYRAITIQREIRGKTFAEMTAEEKKRPEVVKALLEAIQAYDAAAAHIREACLHAGIDPRKFHLGLDIGAASPDDRPEDFDLATYSSPNVMYVEVKKKVFFIDMGWGEWTQDSEKVYALMTAGDTK